jgi:DNA repair ATPase RecN
MTKLPDPIGPVEDGEEGSVDERRLSLRPVTEAGQVPRILPHTSEAARAVADPAERIDELATRLREWVERVDTLETELDYLKRDLEVRIAYARGLERQLDEQVDTVRNAADELAAMRARASYRMVDAVVRRLGRVPVLNWAAHECARKMMTWRDR